MDPVIIEILAQLVRNGSLDQDDISDIAARVEQSGRSDDAHNIRASFLEGIVTSLGPAESPQVKARRAFIHVVPDGGNAKP